MTYKNSAVHIYAEDFLHRQKLAFIFLKHLANTLTAHYVHATLIQERSNQGHSAKGKASVREMSAA